MAVNLVLSAAVGYTNRRATFLVALSLAGTYVLVSAPEIGHGAAVGTLIANTSTYLIFAALGRVMAGFVRRFGRDADEARAAAIKASRTLEVERSRRLLHDPASLLTYLADPDLDPRLAETVRAQALAEANRIRAYLSDPKTAGEAGSNGIDGRRGLVETVRGAAAEFTDLPIEFALTLAANVALPTTEAEAVRAAVATVLHNVRTHAGTGARVVVHADHHPEGEWELSIRDDGVGFDPSATPRGYGLTQLADAALAEQGIESIVESSSGVGTVVTMRGRHDHG